MSPRSELALAFAATLMLLPACGRPTIDKVGGVVLTWKVAGTDAYGRSMEVSQEDIATTVIGLERRINSLEGVQNASASQVAGTPNAIRIELPGLFDEAAIERVKRAITIFGEMQLAIVADRERHSNLSALLETDPKASDPNERLLGTAEEVHGLWTDLKLSAEKGYRVHPGVMPDSIVRDAETGEILAISEVVSAMEAKTARDLQMLIVVYPKRTVRGRDFVAVRSETDVSTGSPSIAFTLSPKAAKDMKFLTTLHEPDRVTGKFYFMGIVLDGELMSAPRLQSPIYERGQITGSFTQDEVDTIVSILRAGQLPAKMEPIPLSEELVAPED